MNAAKEVNDDDDLDKDLEQAQQLIALARRAVELIFNDPAFKNTDTVQKISALRTAADALGNGLTSDTLRHSIIQALSRR